MSKLEKLLIRGIRSFSPADTNVIEFQTPLTIIVGANGTGKTTIIECLKFATAGDMPPNSRGGAFIYDPKIAKDIDVKAEIKLKFFNNKNETLTCFRSMQSTVKRAKSEQKTLECILFKEINGKEVQITSKIADVDRDIPEHLGVSHSILDNVIFCHQDESIWPIGDPTQMKKKLDDIFSSTKYNKALLGLKASKKEVNTDLKLKTQHLSFFLKEKIKRDEILKNIQFYNDEIEKKSEKLKIFDQEIHKINGKIDELTNEVSIYDRLEKNYRVLKIELDNNINFVKNFAFEIIKSPDRESCIFKIEEIERKLFNLNSSRIEEEFNKVELLRRRIVEEKGLNEDKEATIRQLETEIDNLIREKNNINESLMKDFNCNKNEINLKIEESFQKVDEVLKKKTKELEQERENFITLKHQQKSNEKFIKESTDFIQKHKHLKVSDIEIKEISIDYDKHMELEAIVDEYLEEVNQKQNLLNEEFRQSERVFHRNHLIESINNLKEDCVVNPKDLSRQIANQTSKKEKLAIQLTAELKEFQRKNILLEQCNSKNSEILNEIYTFLNELKMLEISTENESNNTTSGANYDVDRSLDTRNNLQTGGDIKNDTIKSTTKFDAIKKSKGEVQPGKVNEPSETVPHNNSGSKEDLRIFQLFSKSMFKNLTAEEILKIKNEFPIHLLEHEQLNDIQRFTDDLEQCKSKAATSQYASRIYQNFIDVGNEKNSCPLCLRGFDKIIKKEFNLKLEKTIQKLPQLIEQANVKKEQLERHIECLARQNQEIKIRNDIKHRLRQNLSSLVVSLSYNNNGIKKIEEEIKEIDGIIDNLKAKHQDSKSKLSRLNQLETELKSIPETVDVTPLREELKKSKVLLESARNELNRYTKYVREQEALKKEIESEIEKRKIILKVDELKEQLQNIEIIDLKGLEEKVCLLEAKVEKSNQKYVKAKVEIEHKNQRLLDIGTSISQKEIEITSIRMSITNTLRDVKAVFNNTVLTYEDIIDSNKFEALRAVLLNHKNQIIELSRSLQLEKQNIRIIEENLELIKVKERIITIEKELENFDISKFNRLKSHLSAYGDKKARITNNESIIKGELKQMAHSLKNLKGELEQYKDSAKNYLICSLEIKALELGLNDLDMCINGLDKAIVDFHSSKIQEVNQALKELWTNTYKGNDIDYIELKAESSDTKAYNYRLVMVKNGVELDMRGRSSAGQKMIASILFRIALADSFSYGCNVLALDEPTTNLDMDNIESLAQTLSLIIKERSNVQLIVITHDEEFVQLLNREGTEYFYRLKRDSKGNGHIQRHSIYKN